MLGDWCVSASAHPMNKTFHCGKMVAFRKPHSSHICSFNLQKIIQPIQILHKQNVTSAYKTTSLVFILFSSKLHPKSWEWLSPHIPHPTPTLQCSLFLLDFLLAIISPTFPFSIAPRLTLSFYFCWNAARWDNIPMALLTGETPQLTSIRDNWKPRQWDCQLEFQ